MGEGEGAEREGAGREKLANPVPGRTIGDHGVIGNLDTAALVAMDGTIDYLCWPHLDSPTIFAALLDPDKGGEFLLAPDFGPGSGDVRSIQLYAPQTNVLVTRFMAEEGAAELIDLMPHPDVEGASRCVIRCIRGTRGRVPFTMRCRPRLDYARVVPEVRQEGAGVHFSGDHVAGFQLAGSFPIEAGEGEAVARFAVEKGEEAWLVLCDSDCEAPGVEEAARIRDETIVHWRRWILRSNYRGRWQEWVERSALALKLLTSAEHGSVAAAATFGLPEATGGTRNWDYRASWIRDASFTVYAFMRLGYVEEAEAFRKWVAKRVMELKRGSSMRIMYALNGDEAMEETILDHLDGYAGSRPVRIGNAARTQTQLDIFGELMDSVYLSNKYGAAIPWDGWHHIIRLVDHVRHHWRDPDEGIWEIRDKPREFLHSRLMCWVALDRAIRLASKRSLPAPLARWIRDRDRIAEDIWANFRHPTEGHFVQTRGGTDLDASLLMMPLMRFCSATDPVWLKTLDAIAMQLTDDGLVFRYRNADGLEGGEGAFTTCTFWFVECLARAGRLDEAQMVMARGLRYANHLGLFSEELDLQARPMGNFPQALTHLAFVSAAYFLNRRLDHPDGEVWQP
jgi:GH15 family glucan-1,4-alpha-glucosidase